MIYLDVRTKSEYDEGHYDNAINHDLALLMQGVLPDIDKDAEIHVYCRSGGRSEIAKEILIKHGFMHVTNIGGFQK